MYCRLIEGLNVLSGKVTNRWCLVSTGISVAIFVIVLYINVLSARFAVSGGRRIGCLAEINGDKLVLSYQSLLIYTFYTLQFIVGPW